MALSRAREATESPLVSIVVPVYNGERYLTASLDSILGQTYRNTEVLVMDDASSDGAPGLLASYDDPRLGVFRQPVNLGIFGNINEGIARARGELVAIHHADDIYEPQILEREVAFLLQHPEAGAVFCCDVFIDGEGREFGRLELPADIAEKELLHYGDVINGVLRYKNVFIRGGSSLIRRTVYDTIGLFDLRYDLRADLDMWLRIAARYPIGILDDHLVRYRYGHDNSSRRYDRLRLEPELSFDVIDDILTGTRGAQALPDALAAFEGHRAEDRLMVAVNRYIAGRRHESLTMLRTARIRRILGTRRVERWRLLVLWICMHMLVRIRRVDRIATTFYSRWHEKDYSKRVAKAPTTRGRRALRFGTRGTR